ncbi:MAG TPA: TonB-dependent receptor [Stellaceae bacterium]|nr:TonB-dependent receptor [Stellaceae bacterium]
MSHRRLPGAAARLLAAASAASLLAPLGALAQSAASSTAPVPEVVVTAPAASDVYDHPTGQTVGTIGREQFQDAPAFSIGDVLKFNEGVAVKQGNGPRDVGISIRGSNARNGFGIRNIQMLEDGFPVTQPDGLSRTDLTDPHAYRSIDVYEGPSSAMFGNYATGGAIDLHTRRGRDIDGEELGSDAGSFGYFNEYGAFGRKVDNYEYSFFGSYVRGDGFMDHSAYDTTTENILASYGLTPDDKLTLKFVNNNLDAALPIRLSLSQYRQNPYQRGCAGLTAAAAFSATGCASVSLFANGMSGATVPSSADAAGLGRSDRRTIFGARWEHSIDADTAWRIQGVFDDKNINQPTGATSAIGDSPAANILTDVTRHGHFLGLEATHFAGLYFNYEHLENFTYDVAPGAFDTDPGANALLGALSSSYAGHQDNFGARAREEVKLAPRLSAVAALGVEHTDLEATNKAFAFPAVAAPTLTPTPVTRTFDNVAPEAALVFRPDGAWTIHGRFATGYGTPQASNLFITPAGVSGNNTQLKTQTNKGFDLGAEWGWHDKVHLGVTGFYEFFENELVTQSPGAGLQSFTFNAPASTHRGVEVSGDWQPLAGLRFLLAYSLDDQYYTKYSEQLSAGTETAVFDRAGNKIPGVAPNMLTARAGYDQPSGPLKGLGGFVELNWQDSFFIDNANLVKAPGYGLVNLNLHYTPQLSLGILKTVTFFFEVQNLFDRVYVASANNVSDSISATTGLQNPASTVAAAGGSIYAGAPRTLIGGVKLKF